MANIFIIADTHFGHFGVCKFLNEDGSKLRPWDHPDEMDEVLVKNWNEVVKPSDRVYHLGDVVMNLKALGILRRLNGSKILIKGNHDNFKLSEYVKYFDDIRASHVLSNMIMTHIPIHEGNFGRFGVNVHGHTHSRRVMTVGHKPIIDPRYLCVSVEHTNFYPLSLEEVKERAKITGECKKRKNK